jgi:hypothetical protein
MFFKFNFRGETGMLYVEGRLSSETRALRQIARSTVNTALSSIETKTAVIVTSLIGKLNPHMESEYTIEHLLGTVFNHPQLNAERAILERYSRAFPELRNSISQRHERNRSAIRRQIERALFPLQTARRFQFAKGWSPTIVR